jgi:hypothetical protein
VASDDLLLFDRCLLHFQSSWSSSHASEDNGPLRQRPVVMERRRRKITKIVATFLPAARGSTLTTL